MKRDYIQEQKYIRAKKKLYSIKGVYWHIAVYFMVNTFISTAKVLDEINKGKSFNDAFFEFETFGLWFVWGFGLSIHVVTIFGKNIFFGKDWEERKLQEFMNNDRL